MEPPPAWCLGLSDTGVGEAPRLLHTKPAHQGAVAEPAARAGLFRAAFAARFARFVGEPPLTYLTGWRTTLAAESVEPAVLRGPGNQTGVAASGGPAISCR